MQSKDYFKNKARKLAKQTWAGPGKFGVFIVICIIVIAFFESIGLSNREKNLELRNEQNNVIPLNYNLEKISEGIGKMRMEAPPKQKPKVSRIMNTEKRNQEIANIILSGAMEQYLFEHKSLVDDEKVDTIDDKTKQFLSLLLKEKEEIIKTQTDDLFMFDV
jgi:hypothetical protein